MSAKEAGRVHEWKGCLTMKAAEVQRISETFRDGIDKSHMVITTEQAASYQTGLKEIKGLIDARAGHCYGTVAVVLKEIGLAHRRRAGRT
ncbi:hypothetical protein [Streptosporangium subroseum]|uniref:hypothetical protein n=1 Tax=Streptosporangium subroseum TaxID=106412 RepID=UPI0030851F14|nr:hypothetical protein OHB15_39960 [Streptosporangium subroseum]